MPTIYRSLLVSGGAGGYVDVTIEDGIPVAVVVQHREHACVRVAGSTPVELTETGVAA